MTAPLRDNRLMHSYPDACCLESLLNFRQTIKLSSNVHANRKQRI